MEQACARGDSGPPGCWAGAGTGGNLQAGSCQVCTWKRSTRPSLVEGSGIARVAQQDQGKTLDARKEEQLPLI